MNVCAIIDVYFYEIRKTPKRFKQIWTKIFSGFCFFAFVNCNCLTTLWVWLRCCLSYGPNCICQVVAVSTTATSSSSLLLLVRLSSFVFFTVCLSVCLHSSMLLLFLFLPFLLFLLALFSPFTNERASDSGRRRRRRRKRRRRRRRRIESLSNFKQPKISEIRELIARDDFNYCHNYFSLTC